jgi:hypothetical protein
MGEGPKPETVRRWERELAEIDGALKAESAPGYAALCRLTIEERSIDPDDEVAAVEVLEKLAALTHSRPRARAPA